MTRRLYLRGEGPERLEVAAAAGVVDGDNRLRPRRDPGFGILEVEPARGLVDLAGDRLCAGGADCLVGSDVGDRRDEDFVAFTDAAGLQREMEGCGRSANTYDFTAAADVGSQLILEGLYFTAEAEEPRFENDPRNRICFLLSHKRLGKANSYPVQCFAPALPTGVSRRVVWPFVCGVARHEGRNARIGLLCQRGLARFRPGRISGGPDALEEIALDDRVHALPEAGVLVGHQLAIAGETSRAMLSRESLSSLR